LTAIRSVGLRPIIDSRAQATVEATVTLASGVHGVAGAPSGASTGTHEVAAWPSGGVPPALLRFREVVEPRLQGIENDQSTVDAALHAADGTATFGRIGGNVATAISVASAIARATESGRPLWEVVRRPGVEGTAFPAVVGNCLNGGRHAIGGPDMQEFIAFATSPRPDEAVRAAVAVHVELGRALHAKYPTLALGRGDEGGWVAPIGNLEALEMLAAACAATRDALHLPVHPGIDLAASEFFRDGRYRYQDRTVDADGQIAFLGELVDRYGIRYLEDPLEEESFEPMAALTRAVGDRTLVVGDDLYTTAAARVQTGVELRSTNAVLIKVNQVGTLTDTARTVDLARSERMATVASHRSGDLPEGWLAHLAVGYGSVGIKCGLLGGERVAKLNELTRLGAALGAP